MIYETFFVGLLLALLYVEIMEIYPGGIIVPAYFALYLDQPARVAATILIALASLLTYKMLSRFLILFGRRRFVMLLLLGALWGQVWHVVFPQVFSGTAELRLIGWVIPGLLANNCEKQRVLPTLASLVTVSVATYFLVRLLAKVF
jgi:poly-gamma-glutamate biosynthesis protein PgsC/CapC